MLGLIKMLPDLLSLGSQDILSPESWRLDISNSRIDVFSWWSSGFEPAVSLINRLTSIHKWWKMGTVLPEPLSTELPGQKKLNDENKRGKRASDSLSFFLWEKDNEIETICSWQKFFFYKCNYRCLLFFFKDNMKSKLTLFTFIINILYLIVHNPAVHSTERKSFNHIFWKYF